jgi:hypothetical protein
LCKIKISPGWLKQNIFLKIQNDSKKILTNFFCFRGVHYKCNFQYAFDDNLSVTHVFIKQIFRAVAPAPPFPLPPQGCAVCRGWGRSGCFRPLAAALVMAMMQ